MLSPLPPDASVSVFVVDDHPVVLDGLRLLLESASGFTVWGTSASGEDALARLLPDGLPLVYVVSGETGPDGADPGDASSGSTGPDGVGPDVVLSDVSLGGLTGLELAVALRVHGLRPPVVLLSSYAAVLFERRVRAAGAQGYVEKTNPGEVINALRAVAAGGEHWHTPAN